MRSRIATPAAGPVQGGIGCLMDGWLMLHIAGMMHGCGIADGSRVPGIGVMHAPGKRSRSVRTSDMHRHMRAHRINWCMTWCMNRSVDSDACDVDWTAAHVTSEAMATVTGASLGGS
jgi:hypothetical protein